MTHLCQDFQVLVLFLVRTGSCFLQNGCQLRHVAVQPRHEGHLKWDFCDALKFVVDLLFKAETEFRVQSPVMERNGSRIQIFTSSAEKSVGHLDFISPADGLFIKTSLRL